MIWVGIGLCVVGWLLGLLLAVGPVVHLLLVVAVVLLVIEYRRPQPA
jgi:hypothetical protein